MQFPLDITTKDFFDAWLQRDARWRGVVERILKREGFGTPELRLLSGSNLSYTFDDRFVFKAFPPEETHEGVIERDLLHACTTDELFATPELVASGSDGWLWVVMTKLPGQELRPLRTSLPAADQLRITEQLAEWAGSFHQAPTVQSLALDRPEQWDTLQPQLRDGLQEKLRKRGLGEAWLEQLPDFYADWKPIDETTLVHADLHDMNILVTEGPDGWELTGVFDFADAMWAPPIYELAAPLLFVARGVRSEVVAFCERVLGEVPDARTLLQWALLHRFAHLQHYLDHFEYVAGAETLEDVAKAVAGLG